MKPDPEVYEQAQRAKELAQERLSARSRRRSVSTIRTNAGSDLAFIFSMMLWRRTLIVISVMPSSAAACLLSMSRTIRTITSRSRDDLVAAGSLNHGAPRQAYR